MYPVLRQSIALDRRRAFSTKRSARHLCAGESSANYTLNLILLTQLTLTLFDRLAKHFYPRPVRNATKASAHLFLCLSVYLSVRMSRNDTKTSGNFLAC